MKTEAKYALAVGIFFLSAMPEVIAQQSVSQGTGENPPSSAIAKPQIPVVAALGAASISAATGVPLSVTLSDFITKSSTANFTSTLATSPSPQPSVNAPSTTLRSDELLPSAGPNTLNPEVQAARAKGYQVRDIDFDSRYVANVTKLLSVPEILFTSDIGQ